MELDISTWMMIAFITFLTLGIWKIYAFLPNEQLADDDKTEESEAKLKALMLKLITQKNGNITTQKLFLMMKENEDFDKELFWRFNQNRLNHLLNGLSVKEVYQKLNS